MNNKVYITGHKNPDTDSIASAIVYADLKSRIDKNKKYIPIRLGKLNLESKWVLERWNVEAPEFIESLKNTVFDLNIEKPITVKKDISLFQAANFLQPKQVQFLPIVDEEKKLIGIVTLSNLTKSYMNVWDDDIIYKAKTPIENIVDVISAKIVHLPENPNKYDGRMLVYASEVDEVGHVSKGDILIVGNRLDAQYEAITRKAGILIITSGHELNDEMMELAKINNVTVLTTKYNSFMVARLIPQAIPVEHVMTTENLQTFGIYDYLEDVNKKVRNTRFRNFPVVDRNDRVIGQLSRNDLLYDEKKQVILVDHNESNQSIDDINSVEIKEIIDHHRVANINTSGPIYFRNQPVGCTSTILMMMYKENGIVPSRQMAGLMASAIISDTLLFRSPTTTDDDRRILKELASIANIDLEEYAEEMFAAGTSLEGQSAKSIIMTDSKKFDIEGVKCRVSQAFTTKLSTIDKMITDIRIELENIKLSENLDFIALFITDIFNERSEVITVGDYSEYLAKEFSANFEKNGYIVDKLMSRKKQFIPAVTAAINKYNLEN